MKEHAPAAAIGGSAGIAMTVMGYILTSNFFVTPTFLETKLADLRLERYQALAEYVRLDDYRNDLIEMKQDIKEIKTLLNRKADKQLRSVE